MLPPEWYRQSSILLTWPHSGTDWRETLADVEAVYCQLVHAILQQSHVDIIAFDAQHAQYIDDLLQAADSAHSIRYCIAESNDSWARDHGPLTVFKDGHWEFLDFDFNAWGGKFDYQLDNQLTQQLHSQLYTENVLLEKAPVIFEGGSIDVNGNACLITTSACLLTQTRNPTMTKADYEQLFDRLFGIKHTYWLEHGMLIGDDTDSHVDMLARFCSPSVIAYTACDNPHDEHFEALQAMASELHAFKQPDGEPFELVALPIPAPIFDATAQRLPASYANFLVNNGQVLVPVYNDPADAIALERLQTCFPQHRITPVNCLPIIEQHGSLHCLTMQIPDIHSTL
jgi:agmatine deiminase